MTKSSDTIFALSTLLGKSGVAIIRISGQAVKEIASKFKFQAKLIPNKAFKHKLVGINSRDLIDECLIIYFKEPKSFTGEDVLEFHTHGSVAVIKRLTDELTSTELEHGRLRIAEAGEFSKRAFFNGKMDLTQAEGLAALIDSETEVQRQIAVRQFSGEQGSLYEQWRSELIKILSLLEALIDFPTDDIPPATLNNAQDAINSLKASISNHLKQGNNAEVLRRGFRVAIVGEPNAGKSTLLNHLVKRQAAIVSPSAGTTRDVIEVKLDLEGYAVIISDTAGIRKSNDQIEQEGVKRSINAIEDSDLCLLVCDVSKSIPSNILAQITRANICYKIIFNKADLFENKVSLFDHLRDLKGRADAMESESITISLAQNNHPRISEITALILRHLKEHCAVSSEPLLTSERHKHHLKDVIANLDSFDVNAHLDIACEYIRHSANALSQITGKINLEEVLDLVFSSFCIGK